MERFIAVDNVCAWPNLTLLPDGTIVAAIYNRPNHGLTEGDVECWISRDGGYFWHKREVPFPRGANENRLNTAAGLNRAGEYILACTGVRLADATFLDIAVGATSDQGASWRIEGGFEKPAGVEYLIPFGAIVLDDDGTLGVCAHSVHKTDGVERFASYYMRSYDHGKTWVEPVLIEKEINETTALSLGGQRLLAAGRTDSQVKDGLTLYRSEDFGKSWSKLRTVTLPNQVPADLILLADGTILLTYGVRNKGHYGLGARISRDGGDTWSGPAALLNFEIATDGGYPSNVQLADGTIVTAYYSNKVPGHHRYHMGVIRWRVESIFGCISSGRGE